MIKSILINEEIKEKTNKKMMILSAIGIIMVILGHTHDRIGLFVGMFPYASFHMALFIFISGYFYKKENEEYLSKYIFKRFKRLVVPYFIWNLVYGIIVNVLKHLGVINFGSDINLYTFFVQPWLDGHQYVFNLAAWFLLALFLVNVLYVLMRKLMTKIKIWDDNLMLFIFFVLSCLSVYISINNENVYLIPLTRTMFFMLFYHFGYCYKTKLEGKLKISNAAILISLLLIQLVILGISDQTYYEAFRMHFLTKNFIIPVITSLTGILFWVKMSEVLEPSLGNSKIVNYIGNNTYEIMMHHIFWIFIFNTILWGITTLLNIKGFSVEEYRGDLYYFFYLGKHVEFLIMYSLFALAGPLCTKYLMGKIIKKYIRESI